MCGQSLNSFVKCNTIKSISHAKEKMSCLWGEKEQKAVPLTKPENLSMYELTAYQTSLVLLWIVWFDMVYIWFQWFQCLSPKRYLHVWHGKTA